MADINIDFRGIRNATYKLPSIIADIERISRNVGLLKWRIPEEIQGRREVGTRINKANDEMGSIKRKLEDIQRTMENIVVQGIERENKLTANAVKFK